MSELPTWGALLRRAWRVLRQRVAPLAPDCADCGFPLTRTVRWFVATRRWALALRKATWGNGDGLCAECSAVRADLAAEAERQRQQTAERDAMRHAFSHIANQTARLIEPPSNYRGPSLALTSQYLGAKSGTPIAMRHSDKMLIARDTAETPFEQAWLTAHPRDAGHIS